MEKKELNKSELVSMIAEEGNITEAESRRILDLVSQTVIEALKENDKITLGNLGKMVKTTTKARTGRNPRTGETIEIPEKIRVAYRPSKEVKDNLEV